MDSIDFFGFGGNGNGNGKSSFGGISPPLTWFNSILFNENFANFSIIVCLEMFFMIRIFKIFSYSVSKLFGYRFLNFFEFKKELFLPINVIRSEKWQKKMKIFSLFFHYFFQISFNQNIVSKKKCIIISLFISRKLNMFFFTPFFDIKKHGFLNENFRLSLVFFLIFISNTSFSYNSLNNKDIDRIISKVDSNYRINNFSNSISYLQILLENEEKLNITQLKYIYFSISQCYYYSGNYEKSILYFNKSINFLKKYNLPYDDEYHKSLVILGMSYFKLGNFDLALSNYNKAENLLLKTSENYKSNIASIYYHKALINYENGDYEKSLMYYEKTLSLYDTKNTDDNNVISRIYNNIGNVFLKKKDYTKAKDYYQKCIAIKEIYSPDKLANSYNAFAVACKLSGEMQVAELYYKKAIENRLKYNNEHPDLGKDYLNYGDFCFATNKNEKAYSYYQKAHQLFEKFYGNKSNLTSASLVAIGDYFYKTNKIKKALYYYQEALIAVSEKFNIKDINYNPLISDVSSKLSLLKALKGKAQSISKLDNSNVSGLKISLKSYQLAIDVIAELSKSYLSDESKMFLNDNEKETYVSALEISEKLFHLTSNNNYINLAFTFAEKSKASTLMSNIRANEAIKYGKIPSFVQNIEQTIKNQISYYEQILISEKGISDNDNKSIRDIKNKLFDLKQNQEKFYQFLDRNYNKYYDLKYNHNGCEIAALQQNLKQKEAIVEYVLTENKIFSFLITKDFYTINSKSIDNKFYQNIEIVRNYSSTNTFGNSSLNKLNNYTSASYQLYEDLLKPFENIISWCHLTIIPDKELNLISFETLLNKQTKCSNFNYNELPYLIKEHPISYSYSAALLLKKSSGNITNDNLKLLAFAPIYKNKSVSDNLLANNTERNGFSSLPYAKDEIKGISEFFKGQVFTDYNANKKSFIKQLGDNSILHLAMHAEMNNENPMYSKLIFSESSYGSNDGMMMASDIYNMNINSRLVVLSACNTGDGKLRNGEGIMSLARAFLYAGCPSVVMTLWSVEDKAGSDLMISFYSYLSKGYSKDKALQLAKIDYIQNSTSSKSHPYFWAAYVPIGDQSPVAQSPKDYSSLAFFALIAGVGIGITPFFTNRKLKRKIYKTFRFRSRVYNC